MAAYDRAMFDGKHYWSLCGECDSYTYVPKDTREHMMQVHGASKEHVDAWYADEPIL